MPDPFPDPLVHLRIFCCTQLRDALILELLLAVLSVSGVDSAEARTNDVQNLFELIIKGGAEAS